MNMRGIMELTHSEYILCVCVCVCIYMYIYIYVCVVHGHLGQWVVATSTEKSRLINPEGNLAPQPTSKA